MNTGPGKWKSIEKLDKYAYCNNCRAFAQLLSLDFEFTNNTNCRAMLNSIKLFKT
jgi:hypothetical protein